MINTTLKWKLITAGNWEFNLGFLPAGKPQIRYSYKTVANNEIKNSSFVVTGWFEGYEEHPARKDLLQQ